MKPTEEWTVDILQSIIPQESMNSLQPNNNGLQPNSKRNLIAKASDLIAVTGHPQHFQTRPTSPPFSSANQFFAFSLVLPHVLLHRSEMLNGTRKPLKGLRPTCCDPCVPLTNCSAASHVKLQCHSLLMPSRLCRSELGWDGHDKRFMGQPQERMGMSRLSFRDKSMSSLRMLSLVTCHMTILTLKSACLFQSPG